MSQLADTIHKKEQMLRAVDVMDEALFSRFLPVPSPPRDEVDAVAVDTPLSEQNVSKKAGSPRRPISEVDQLLVNPLKKSKVPALASVAQVALRSELHNTPKKKVLITCMPR